MPECRSDSKPQIHGQHLHTLLRRELEEVFGGVAERRAT